MSGTLLVNSCGTLPHTEPCLVESKVGGCYYIHNGDELLRDLPHMDKNVCHTWDEDQAILLWIERHGGPPAKAIASEYQSYIKTLVEKTSGINNNYPGL